MTGLSLILDQMLPGDTDRNLPSFDILKIDLDHHFTKEELGGFGRIICTYLKCLGGLWRGLGMIQSERCRFFSRNVWTVI